MRHFKKGRTLHRKRDPRRALIKGLAQQVVLHGRIVTTEAKAKEVRPVVEKLVTKARTRSLHARRELARVLGKTAVKKLVDEIAPKFEARPGGYTRIIKLGTRPSDRAPKARIEFVA